MAAFAGAGFGRLLLVQFIVALLAAAAVVWFVDNIGFPAITAAIQKLPPTGEIRSRQTGLARPLAGIARHRSYPDAGCGPGSLRSDRPDAPTCKSNLAGKPSASFSLLGYLEWNYPAGYVIAFNRNTLEPLWGAWAAELLIMVGAAAVIGCLLSWWLLATLYFLPVWLLGFFANRDLNFRQSWRLAGAALMPGALLMVGRRSVLRDRFLEFGFLRLHLRRSFCHRLDLSVRQPAFCAARAGHTGTG